MTEGAVFEFEGLPEFRARLPRQDRAGTVSAWLETRAHAAHEGLAEGDRVAASILTNWHPEYLGQDPEALAAVPPALTDMQHAVAREHGFEDWSGAATCTTPLDPVFESAIDHAQSGDLRGLRDVVARNPEVVKERSAFGHRATLLLYMAANGVEMERQRTPANAPDVVRLLVEAGADPSATMHVYGGEHGVRALLTTSAWPRRAGVVDSVLEALEG